MRRPRRRDERLLSRSDDDFVSGGLPRESYVNPWTVVTIRNADMEREEGHLIEATTEQIATEAAGYLGVR